MVGITSYGGYIPLHRLSREEFFRAWGGFAMPGERAVANFDEDSVTMATEAAIDCMKGIDPKTVDGLFFATTTSPYREKQCSAIISVALDLGREIRTADFTGSLRAGTIAIASAMDAINAGAAKSIMVTAADLRLGAPAGDFEQALGDGGAALLLGEKGVIATIEGSYSISDDFSGVWRSDADTFVRTWEDRMVLDEGYSAVLPEAISGLMKKYNLAPGDFAKVVYDTPTDIRRHARVTGGLKFDAAQLQDPLFMTVGNTGAALAMMMLVAALEEAKPGDRILFASYGNGADAFVLQVTPEIEKVRDRRGIKNHLASKRMLALIPVRSHHNGSLNPKAHYQREITMEQVLGAPIIAWPLGLFDCCGVSDGAAAAIVVRAEDAKKFREDPVYVKALQICVGPGEGQLSTVYDYTHVEETYRAGLAAYAEAGISDPRKEISMAEVHDCFSITEATIMEDLQFSPRGRVKEDLEAGTFTLEGDLPVQPDGGLKCFGHPIGASGLRMMYEMYLQLQGRAGPRQIKNPQLGLTHNMGGQPGACTVSCLIVGL